MDNPWRAGRLTIGHRTRLVFGRMYEDHGVELALFPPASRVLAIASAGDVTAALARAGHRVTAVDVNPTQLAYARARLAGAPAVAGSAERILAVGRAAAGARMASWRPAALTRFLSLEDPAAQADWWGRRLDRPPLAALMRVALGPAGLLATVLRRGLRDVIGPGFDVTLRRRIGAGVARFPNADNPFAWQLLLGRARPVAGQTGPGSPDPASAGPGSAGSSSTVEWRHADVIDHLDRGPARRYDAVTLSNVVDGAPPGFAADLYRALSRAVRPGAPVVLRTFADRAPLPGRRLTDRSLLWGAVTAVRIGD